MNTRLILLAIALFFANATMSQKQPDAVAAAHKIDYDYFFRNLEFLASDELEGRDVGSKGYAKAADHIAEEAKANGLEPFGDNGSFFQKVPFAKGEIVVPSLKFEVKGNLGSINGKFGENISLMLNPKGKSFETKQELVFVGYGNVIPDLNIDDYKGVDVKGKTVIVAFGGPKGLKHQSLGNPFVKLNNATERGATGIIIYVPNRSLLQGAIFRRFHNYIGGPGYLITDESKNKRLVDVDLLTFAKKSFIKSIFAQNGLKLSKELSAMKKGGFVSKALQAKVTCSYDISYQNRDCKNIVAVLPGNDPELKHEYIIVGAHLDHLGIGKIVKGDSIYNGMWDNASGSAAIISLARAFHKSGIKPKRSIVFAHYTAEEKGLFGSHYLANSELLKNKKVVANVNIDMLGGLYETSDITPLGYTHSNLSEAIDYVTNKLGLTVNDPTTFERMYIERSDQFSFIKTGVPVISINGGQKGLDPKIDVTAKIMKWMQKFYHSPADDLNQQYSPKAFHTALKVNFLTTYFIANEMSDIEWKNDSWLYKKYVQKGKGKKEQAKIENNNR